MGSKIVQARNIRNNDVVLASTAAELLTLLAFYQGTSNTDPNYLVGVTIQLLPIDYTFTQAQLPLLVRSGMSLLGTGPRQTRLLSAQTTSVGAKPIVSCLNPYGVKSYNVTLAGFTIVGDAYATAGIYVKGLQSSTIRDIQIRNMTASGSIGVQIDASVGFGVYYNHLQSVEVGFPNAGSGAGIGFRLKTTDLATEPKRVNSNSMVMCSAKFCIDAGYELNGAAAITMTACEAELNSVGLRVLSCINTVVSGGYFENQTTSDIQLGELSGVSQASQQTILIQPVLVSTNRLTGLSRGATGDVYLVANDGTAPSSTKYDGNWCEKLYINQLYAGVIRSAQNWTVGTSDIVTVDITPFATQTVSQQIWRSTTGFLITQIDASGRFVTGIGSFAVTSTFNTTVWSGGFIGWASTGTVSGTSVIETGFVRDGAAGVIASRSGTQAHTHRIYNTWAAAGVDFERGNVGFISNVFTIGSYAGGTGTLRDIHVGVSGNKIGFYGTTAIVKPTTAFASAVFVANAGTAVNDASTFDGYTLKQVVAALRAFGLLT